MRTALVIVLLACTAVRAASDLPLSGAALRLTKRAIAVTSRDAAIALGRGEGSPDDPKMHDGSLRVLSTEGDVFDSRYVLRHEHWRALRRKGVLVGWRFKNGRGQGPIRRVLVKAGKLVRIVGHGELGHTLGADPAPVRIVLTLGEQQLCLHFGGSTEFKAGKRYLASDATAPDVCPLPYDQPTHWLCRPGMEANQCLLNRIDATVVRPDLTLGTDDVDAADADRPYDCFYVYPTVDLTGPVGNHTDFSDRSLELDPLLSQVARLRGQCRIFAPLYRQITFATFGAPDSARFLDVAYRDVLDAFRLYLARDNGGRKLVVMGHSQGTFMATRLLQDEVDGVPALRSRLIVALLIGGSVAVPDGGVVGGTFQNIPLCTSDAQTGCAIAYRSYAEGYPPAAGSNAIGQPGMDQACTNPAALAGGPGRFSGTYLPTHLNQPLFQIAPDPGFGTPFVELADFYSGECVKDDTGSSYLRISVTPVPGDLRQNPIPFDAAVLSPALLGTHIIDYNWAMGDLVRLVATKAALLP